MSFFNKRSRGNRRRWGRRPNVVRQEGRNKRIHFSIHLDVNSDDFNELIQTWCLDLGGKLAMPQPLPPPYVPLQSHPSITDFPKQQSHPIQDGWENNVIRPPICRINWLISLIDPPLLLVTTPMATIDASFVDSPPKNDK